MQLNSPCSTILLAALALPGLQTAARADTPPERGEITLSYLDYRDRQPGLDRVTVHAPGVSVMMPVAGAWTLEASLVHDAISGATPRYHTAISGASRMDDSRRAADARVTRHFSRGSLSVSASHSNENDYLSRALGVQGRLATEDQNTSLTVGAGVANDRINPVNQVVRNERKHTVELLAGVTQVLGVRDVAQLDLTHADGAGYYSDPYKFFDIRPRSRIQNTALLRWNHHFDASAGTSRLGYRYYRDSYAIRAHTFTGEYVQPLADGWTLTPSARWYSQSAAQFYADPLYDPQFGAPLPANFDFTSGAMISQDQRLSAFGALTVGMKVEKRVGADWLLSVKLEHYRQRASLRLDGSGSAGLAPFSARTWQLAVTRLW